MLGQLVGGFITIIIGVTLVPSVANLVTQAQWSNASDRTNITGASATILNLTTLFFCLGVTTIGIAISSQGLRAAGML